MNPNPHRAYLHNHPEYTGQFTEDGKAIRSRRWPEFGDTVTLLELMDAGHVIGMAVKNPFPWDETINIEIDGECINFEYPSTPAAWRASEVATRAAQEIGNTRPSPSDGRTMTTERIMGRLPGLTYLEASGLATQAWHNPEPAWVPERGPIFT